jgi:hypothetical protein
MIIYDPGSRFPQTYTSIGIVCASQSFNNPWAGPYRKMCGKRARQAFSPGSDQRMKKAEIPVILTSRGNINQSPLKSVSMEVEVNKACLGRSG